MEIGAVGKPHGVQGRIKVVLYHAGSDSLFRASRVFLKTRNEIVDYEIADIQDGPHGPLLCLSGVTDRGQAEQLKGAKVCVLREEMNELESGEFYVADLMGLEVWEGSKPLGRITGSREQGGVEIVTIESDSERLELPLIEDYVVEIDFENGRVAARGSDLLLRSEIKRASKRRQ